MIYGEYKHTIDAKSRTFVPAKLREQLGDEIVITIIADKCISVYSRDAWDSFQEKLLALPAIKAKEVRRRIYPFTNEITIDVQGRILIPQNLRERAELEKNIVSIGVGDHVEIWNEDNYMEMQNNISDEEINLTLIELGM